MAQCPECNEEIRGDEVVCPHCLAPLIFSPASTAADEDEEVPAVSTPKSAFQPVGVDPLDESVEDENRELSEAAPPPGEEPSRRREPLFQDSETLDTLATGRPSMLKGWRAQGFEEEEWSDPVTVTLPGRLGRLRWLFALALVVALIALGVGIGRHYGKPEPAMPAVSPFELGMELFAQERYQAAQYLFGEAIGEEMAKAEPEPEPALTMMGWSAYHAGDYDEALTYFGVAMGMDSESSDAYVGMGLASLALGDPEEAELWLAEALDFAPNSPEAHKALGKAYLAQEERDLAIASLRRANDLAPEDHEVHLLLGMALYENGEYEEAVKLLSDLADAESDPAVMRALIDSYIVLAQHDNAVSAAGKLLETDPTDAELQYQYGLALLRADRREEAEKQFSQVVKSPIAHLVGDAYRQLGLSLSNQEKYEEALVPLSKALALDPDDAEALELSGWALARLGQCADALPLFEHALKIDAGRAGAAEGWAACQEWLGL